MAKKPQTPHIPVEGEFYVPKKVMDAFKLRFQTVFDRRLTTLFTYFAEEDFYILSDDTPYLLMAGNSKTSYGFVDLSREEDDIRLGIRKMVLHLGGKNLALRTDFFTQLINNYFGKPFPKPFSAINVDREDIWVWWRREGIANYDLNRIRKIIGDKDFKDKNSSHLLKAAWPIEGSFFTGPLTFLKDLYHQFIKNDDLKSDFIPGNRGDITERVFSFAGNDYQIVPVPGVDTLSLDKVKQLLGSRILLKENSARIFSYATYAICGTQEHQTALMITRPDIILYPLRRSSQ